MGFGALVIEEIPEVRELWPRMWCWRKGAQGDWLEGMCCGLTVREKGKAAFWGDVKGRKLTQRPEK